MVGRVELADATSPALHLRLGPRRDFLSDVALFDLLAAPVCATAGGGCAEPPAWNYPPPPPPPPTLLGLRHLPPLVR